MFQSKKRRVRGGVGLKVGEGGVRWGGEGKGWVKNRGESESSRWRGWAVWGKGIKGFGLK